MPNLLVLQVPTVVRLIRRTLKFIVFSHLFFTEASETARRSHTKLGVFFTVATETANRSHAEPITFGFGYP